MSHFKRCSVYEEQLNINALQRTNFGAGRNVTLYMCYSPQHE